MTDQAAGEQAVDEGATRLTETDRTNPFVNRARCADLWAL